ncbi:MAG: IMP cyclohydrolase [Candidatus Aminicenantales bacterium]
MSAPPSNLSGMKYPGRVILIGRDLSDEHNIVVYILTGRSASSQARKLEPEKNRVWTKPTDTAALKKGNVELLLYPAIAVSSRIAVSNGRQTLDVLNQTGRCAVEVLTSALQAWEYEPDAPIYTPRISGCLIPPDEAALHIIQRGEDGTSRRLFHAVPLIPGKGKFIATYSGENTDPLKPFTGEPLEVDLPETTAQDTAEAVFEALKPEQGQDDYRVAVACLFAPRSRMNDYRVAIINRQERKYP